MLPPNAKYRLGLSATPERRFDPVGNKQLDDYFGNVIFRYGLKEALANKVLCPYRYEPVPVELCPDEADEYLVLTEQIARVLARNEDLDEPTAQLEMLLIKRARLIATARNKLPALASIFRRQHDSSHNLVYCGDGSVEREQGDQIERQIDAVTRLLGRELGMRVAKYTADTPLGRRDALRRDVANGSVQCLIAIRCLDEGVDIPEIRRAVIIASSTNPRQFIQRRGRLLRRAEGKELAEIFDFFVLPPSQLEGDDREVLQAERALVGRELVRAIEFANLAVNGPEALQRLLPIRDHYRLLDLGVEGEGV
jgi:superfamily II DNA or RNA helicase